MEQWNFVFDLIVTTNLSHGTHGTSSERNRSEMRVSTLKTRGITIHAITMESHVTGSSAIMSESNRACNLHSWLLAALQCVHSQKHVCCTRCKRIPQSSNLLATDGNNRPKWPRSIVRDPRHDRVQTSPPPSPQDTILNLLYFFFLIDDSFSLPMDDRPKSFARKRSIFCIIVVASIIRIFFWFSHSWVEKEVSQSEIIFC